MPKNNLNDLLDNKPPRIKKPKGLTISTDLEEQAESTSAPVQKDTNALMPESTNVLKHKDTSAQVHKSTNTEMQEGTNALEHKNTSVQMQESTRAQEHKNTSTLMHKDTGAEVQKNTNALVQESTSTLEHKNSSAVEQENTSVQMQESTNAPAKDPRPSKGYKIRTDIADACKLLAVQRKRKMYEVMEEGLLMYLRQQGVDIS